MPAPIELLDLSHRYVDGMFASAGLPAPRFDRIKTLGPRSPNVTGLSMPVHTGTHVDCPRHFVADGLAIDEVPLARFHGEAVAVRIRRGPHEEITADDLARALQGTDRPSMVVLSTGYGEKFADPAAYAQHPFLHQDAAQLLVDRGVGLLAMDLPTPDMPELIRPEGFDWPIHRILLEAEMLIVENLADVSGLEGQRFGFAALPIAIAGADGAPVRAVAWR